MREISKVKDNRSYTVALFEGGRACIYSQAVNPKTGKGWQKSKHIGVYESHAKAMWTWCKL